MNVNINLIVQLTINGILLGAFYAAMTMGFSIIWGVMRMINLAHGEFLLMGAYVAWFFFNPNREQSLLIGGDVAEVATTVRGIFIGGGLIVGAIVSEFVVVKHVPNPTIRRVTSLVLAVLVSFGLFEIWQGEGFPSIEISMMFLVMAGLALSLAFVLNHFVLRLWIANGWLRRAVGYPVGIGVALIFHNRWEAAGFTSLDPFLVLSIIVLIFFALGYGLQRALFNRLVESPALIMLLITFAIAIILQNLSLKIYKADPRIINTSYAGAFWPVFDDITLSKVKFYILIACGLLLFGLLQFLQRTKVGYAIRAASQNSMAARLMGININETYAITFGVALALTAAVGAMMGMIQPMTPFSGAPWTLRAFAIVALGGLGRVQGVVVGGLVLGLAESYIGGAFSTGLAVIVAFVLLVVMLVARPQGITGGLRVVEVT